MRKAPWQVLPVWGPILAPLGHLYGLIMAARRRSFARRPERSRSLGRPTISVGNLVVGGTGKTPFVVLLLELLPPELRPALVLARGYGARLESPQGPLDEEGCLILKRRPDAFIAQGADRIAAAEPAIEEAKSVILDDGAQHLKIRRDLDILLFDPKDLSGPRYPLPAGPWRESLDAAGAAQLFVLTRCDECSPSDLERASKVLSGRFPETPQLRSRHLARRLRGPDGRPLAPASLAGSAVIAISGIARPDSFVQTLKSLGAEIVERLDFADHQDYGPDEAEHIARVAEARGDARLVTTEKDAAKLSEILPTAVDLRLEVLEVDLEIISGRAFLEEALAGLLARGSAQGRVATEGA